MFFGFFTEHCLFSTYILQLAFIFGLDNDVFKVPYVTKLLETGLYRLVKEVNEIFMVFFEDKGVVSAPKMPVGGRRGADILILK